MTVDKPWRSLAKSLSWRMTGTVDTIFVSWLVTGKIGVALSIGGVEIVTKMVLYYFHERLWNRVSWGRVRPAPVDYEI